MKRLTTAALTGILLTGGLAAVAQPTQAAPDRQAAAVSGTAVSRAAAGSTGTYYFLFDKNQSDPTKSKLSYMKSVPGQDKVIKSYRAGSGNGSKDECAPMRGWLPNGSYKVLGHEKHKAGGKKGINGYAIHVQDKYCKDGRTKRTELFIHSEMKPDGEQGAKLPGQDNPYRWDGVRDYYSYACIKLTPNHIRDLFRTADRYGWPKQLKVVS
ncbi:invasion associated locus B family protein [Streptomyces achromogenes]|uniref:hypothetical protein n=1 Tax=Streptomyces achromogenes TaxID=67255 RepID=UPI00324DEFAD